MCDEFKPTNTMASVSFDVLKMDGIDDPLINVNKLATMDLEESYFNLAVNFIKEMNNEITANKIILYKSISEANTDTLLLESFSDYFSKVSAIIDKFIKFIKSLVAKFITAINSLISSDKYLIKHKKDFSKFKTADEFDIYGYEYTFSPNIPIANANAHFTTDYLFGDVVKTVGNVISIDPLKSALESINLEDICNDFRANVIGKQSPISASEFAEELFRVYRNDEMDTTLLEITSTEVHKSLDRVEQFKKSISSIEHDQKRIEKDYELIKKNVKDITKRNGDLNKSALLKSLPTGVDIDAGSDGLISSELMIQLDRYTQAKADQITEFSNIHILAFSAKLDAMKEAFKQDKAILYKALQQIQRTSSKRQD